MTTVSLREPPGQPVQVALDGGDYFPVPPWVGTAIRAQLAGVELVITRWGLVLELRGEWANTAAGCREAARMLESRARGLEGNGNGRGEDDTTG